ncbi:MAG: ABA4-like family protein [Pseudomonadota bacterium]
MSLSPEALFSFINMSVLPAWLLLVLLPRWRYTQTLTFGCLIPILSIVYATLLIRAVTSGGGFEMPDFSSLEGVTSLLSNPYGLVAGWAHYLAFDLFVGAWIVRDSQTSRVPHLLIIVPLFFTFMAGPFGLILYLVMRQIARREVLAEPEPKDQG